MSPTRIFDGFVFAVYFAVTRLVGLLPRFVTTPIGYLLGLFSYLVLRRRRRLATSNIDLALPDLGPDERRRITRESFVHFGVTYWETMRASQSPREKVLPRVDVQGIEHLDAAAASGKGYFLLTGHYGAGDLAAYPVSQHVGPIRVVARDLRNPFVNRDVLSLRRRLGMEFIPRRGAGAYMLQTVRTGGRVALTIDQRVQPEDGFLLPFMGRPAWTSRLLAKLSVRSRLPVLPVYCLFEGNRLNLTIEPAITPAGDGIEEEIALTRRYLESLEDRIRRRPELWMWMQRRWRRTPRFAYGPRFEGLTRESQLPAGASVDALRSEALPRAVRDRLRELASGEFLERGESLLFSGERELSSRTARGLGLALAQGGFPVAYRQVPGLLSELARGEKDGKLTRMLYRLDRYPLLILDDADLAPAGHAQELLGTLLRHRQWKLSTLFVQRPAVGSHALELPASLF